MHDDRELIEAARDAVRDLLDASDHDSWLTLRLGYRELQRELDRTEKAAGDAEKQSERERWMEERRERERVWREKPMAARESLVLQALGEERLLLRELLSRLNVMMGADALYHGDVRYVAVKMWHAGLLDRVAEPFKGKTRYRYFRARGLDGPIVELDRQFGDDGLRDRG